MFEELKNKQVLDDGQVYIYALLNDKDQIKIGRTTDLKKRIEALSGSNGVNSNIIRYYSSAPTYLYTLESICHDHFSKYRIKGTEWFYGEDLYYETVISYMQKLFESDEYKRCNDLRKQINERK